jgi:hypothetical protein
VRVHEHLGENVCHSFQFRSRESVSILEVILKADQSLFAVRPVRAGTVSDDVSNVLNTQTYMLQLQLTQLKMS